LRRGADGLAARPVFQRWQYLLADSATLSGAQAMKRISAAGWFWISYLTIITLGVAAWRWL